MALPFSEVIEEWRWGMSADEAAKRVAEAAMQFAECVGYNKARLSGARPVRLVLSGELIRRFLEQGSRVRKRGPARGAIVGG